MHFPTCLGSRLECHLRLHFPRNYLQHLHISLKLFYKIWPKPYRNNFKTPSCHLRIHKRSSHNLTSRNQNFLSLPFAHTSSILLLRKPGVGVGGPRCVSQLSDHLLISVHVMISGSQDGAARRAPRLAQSLLEILFSSSCPSSRLLCLSL